MLQTNATLTRVQGASSGESYDGPAAAGPERWAGEAEAYFRERRDRLRQARGEDRAMIRELFVGLHEPDLEWRSGDIVTFETRRGEITGTVKTVDGSDPPADIPAELATRRLTLETA